MARAFLPDGEELVAVLDAQERAVLRGLCEQVRELVRPADAAPATTGTDDPFEAIVAGLGDLSTDVPAEGTGADDLPGRDFGRDVDDEGGAAGGRDGALDRLFPAGSREDEQEAAEFRRLTEQGLRRRKTGNLDVAIAALTTEEDELRLTRREAPAVVVALTDVRLVMGERIGLRTDEDAERVERLVDDLDEEDPARFVLAVYDFVTWLQESLTQALLRG